MKLTFTEKINDVDMDRQMNWIHNAKSPLAICAISVSPLFNAFN